MVYDGRYIVVQVVVFVYSICGKTIRLISAAVCISHKPAGHQSPARVQ